MAYNENTKLFTISFDSNGFGNNLQTYYNALLPTSIPVPANKVIVSPINQDQRLRLSTADENFSLFFNSNMFGLFSNFNNIYYGLERISNNGLDNLILATNERTASWNPLVVSGGAIVGRSTIDSSYPRTLYPMTQNYGSISTLWSPIASIVFCSTLLPTLPENTGSPLVVSPGDNTSINTSSNAFQPIITDIALPVNYADDYRQFIAYTPTSEYRLTSLGTSQVDVREINIQVYWKHRLTNELIPVTLFNQSSVGIKILFRRRNGGK
jgi:hypothetical protein